MSTARTGQYSTIKEDDFSRSSSIQIDPKTGYVTSSKMDEIINDPNSNISIQKQDSKFSDSGLNDHMKKLELDHLSPRTQKKRLSEAIKKSKNMPFVIGIAGGTNAGKKGLCKQIISQIENKQSVAVISMDQFYKPLDVKSVAEIKNHNFDAPDSIDIDFLIYTLKMLKTGQQSEVPIYDSKTGQRQKEKRIIKRSDVILIEGIFVLYFQEIRELCNMKIFVDADDDVRLGQRVTRDVLEKGRTAEDVINYYVKYIKPSFEKYISPTKQLADIIIPQNKGTAYSPVAIDLVTWHLKQKMKTSDLRRVYPNLVLTDQGNYQIKRLHTIIRDKTTSKNDFVFYSDQLNRIVVESALGLLPFKRKAVTTPINSLYVGVEFHKGLCGVSIVQSGESMENALRACCQGIKIGKILVLASNTKENAIDQRLQEKLNSSEEIQLSTMQTENNKYEDVVYQKLPPDVAQRYVLLMDPVVTTGYTVQQAIEFLLSRGVSDQKIILITLISSPEGISHLFSLYPNITLVTSEIDHGLDKNQHLSPGVGFFGDRYFAD